MSLIEVLVGMTLMAMFMAMFTTGILQLYKTTNQTESIADAQSQVNTAIARLDTQVRYASAISSPGCFEKNLRACGTSDARYVEFVTKNTGDDVCTQLRVTVVATGGTLSSRTKKNAEVAGPWRELISGISAPVPAVPPFTLGVSGATDGFQTLRVQLAVASGAGDTASTKRTDIAFTAVNSIVKADRDAVCLGMRPA